MNNLSMFDLSGKTALVTGCNKGIGLAMAIALAEAGADIIGVSGSMELKNSEVQKRVNKAGKQFFAYQANLADRNNLYSFIHTVKKEHPVVDILINNAGTIMRKPAVEHPDEYWDQVMALNLDTPFILTREFGKEMLERGNGKIIFTCSLLTFQGGITVPGYAASKAALGSLLKAFSNEWASKGINVNGIAPGYIITDNTKMLREDAERNKAILDRIPAGRWGNPEELKGVTVFLSSSASDYINGTIITVDGGWMGR